MLKYCIQVIANSLSASLLTALFFALVPAAPAADAAGTRKVPAEQKRLLLSAGAGLAAALVLAVLRRTTTIVNRELVNIPLLVLLAGAAAVLLVSLWCKRRALFRTGGMVFLVSLWFYSMPTVFLYPAEFTAAGESPFSADTVARAAGFLLGLAVTALGGLAVYHSARPFPGKVRLSFTALAGAAMIGWGGAFIQILLARRLIRFSRPLFRLTVFILNHGQFFLFFAAAVGALFPALLFAAYRRVGGTFSNPAERRKALAGAKSCRRLAVFGFLLLCGAVFSQTALKSLDSREVELSPAEPMTVAGEEILIPVTTVEDGRLHRFAWTASDGTEVRFIVIKKNAASYGVGLDACDICGNTGYYERKDGVVCKLCDVVMNKSTIGFKGGCNPVPLAYRLREGSMVIQIENLEREKGRFHL
ncbi:MAG: Fe-S-containing protein [Treponema sp.]|jgi:uncharacterized membrane protein|nr:Fe-S-containing protein [Treponema sp.]